MILASPGLSRNSSWPRPRSWAARGTTLLGVATSHFHAVAVTTTGTTHGRSSSVLRKLRPYILFLSSSASARPTTQLPNTPTRQYRIVNSTDCQKTGLCRTIR